MTPIPPTCSDLLSRAQRLGLWGLCAQFELLGAQSWVPQLLDIEEQARRQRSLERRIQSAHLGTFRSMADFDPDWPTKLDPDQVQDAMSLGFIKEHENIILLGPNGVGKTMIAKNVSYQALLAGSRHDRDVHHRQYHAG